MDEMMATIDPLLTPNRLKTISLSPSSSPRSELFKNKGKESKELRRRRSETVVELRKQQKDTNRDKRRHISHYDCWSDNEEMAEEEENRIDGNQILIALKTSNNLNEIPAKYVRHLRRFVPKGREVRSNEEKQLMIELMSDDMIAKLNDCLKSEECPLVLLYEVVALMAQLCSADKNQTLVLIKSGIVGNLLNLLSFDSFKVIEESVLGLTYIWNCCQEFRQIINSTQFLNRLLALIESETSVSPSKYDESVGRTELIRTISWSLCVMSQNRDPNSYRLSVALIPHFMKLLTANDSETTANVLKALSATTEKVMTVAEDESSSVLNVVQTVVANNSLFASIIDYLSPKDDDVVLFAIRIIGNIVSWGEVWTQFILQSEALKRFQFLLKHQNSCIQREAAFTVSNITAGNFAQIQAVIDVDIIPAIVELLYMGDYKTQVEASHALLNISAVGSVQQISYLVNINNKIPNMDAIDAMATLLTFTDSKVVENCLKFYNNVLVFAKKAKIMKAVLKRCDNCSAYYHMDLLQNSKNSHVAVLALHIIDEYFSTDSSLEEDLLLNASIGSDGEKTLDLNFSF